MQNAPLGRLAASKDVAPAGHVLPGEDAATIAGETPIVSGGGRI
ncbi:MAG: hypothetical protein AAGI51_08110 [Pseudomonadota bacterium]